MKTSTERMERSYPVMAITRQTLTDLGFNGQKVTTSVMRNICKLVTETYFSNEDFRSEIKELLKSNRKDLKLFVARK